MNFPRQPAASSAGLVAGFALPIYSAGGLAGVLEFFTDEVRPSDEKTLHMVAALGTQLGVYVQPRSDHDARRSRFELQTILEGIADGVVAQDGEGRPLFANSAALELFGFTSTDELSSRTFEDLLAHFEIADADGASLPLEALPGPRALRGDDPREVTIRLRRRPGGRERILLAKGTAIRDSEGETTMAITVFEDVTEHLRNERRHRFLAAAGEVLSLSLDEREVLEQIAWLAVPDIADWCVVDLVGPNGSLERVALAHRDPDKVAIGEELQARYPPADQDAPHGVAQVIKTGETEFYEEIGDDLIKEGARDAEHEAALRSLGIRSGVVAPMTARGRTLGAITLITAESGLRLTPDDRDLIDELARRCALAVDNARLYGDQRRAAEELQRGLMPAGIPELPGLAVATRYRPGSDTLAVGGDFYEVFKAGDAWAVAIGDVSGHGPASAALSGLVRHTMRAVARFSSDPVEILAAVNDAIRVEYQEDRFCTAVLAMLRPAGDQLALELASGGHLPVLIRRASGDVEPLGESSGALLGVFPDAGLTPTTASLSPGDLILLHTDGLTEARARTGEVFGEERVRAVLSECGGRGGEAVIAALEKRLADESFHPLDDLAIITLQVGNGATHGGH